MKSFFGSCLGALCAVLLLVMIGFGSIMFFVILAASSEKAPSIPRGSLLVIDLSVPIMDSPEEFDPATLLAGLSGSRRARFTLREVLRAIEKAARDDRIAGIFLTGGTELLGSPGSGYATLGEVRAALMKFKASKKPIIAYLSFASTRTVYAASVAEEIYLDPYGVLLLSGLASERLFFAGAFQKFGIGVQVARVGKYKSAVEPYTNEQMSPESREQTTKLLSDLWQEITTGIEQARGMEPGTIQALLTQNGLLDPETGLRNKLGTALATMPDVTQKLKERFGEERKFATFKQASLDNYIQTLGPRPTPDKSIAKIGIVYAEGVIVDGEGQNDEVGGERFARAIKKFRTDSSVKAIVLRINSPGGSAAASETIYREMRLAKASKPVIVSMGSVAASGGYYIAAAANRIYADPNTITGSIGIFGLIPNLKQIGNNNGFTWDSVETTPFASLFTLSRPRTDQEMAVIQRFIDKGYAEFLERVAEGRNLPVAEVNEVAQGRVWSGLEALRVKLVDELGGFDQAVGYAANLVKLGASPRIAEYPAREDLSAKLDELLKGSPRPPVIKLDPISRKFRQLESDLRTLRSLNDPMGAYMLLPIGLRVE
jgi:protease-4